MGALIALLASEVSAAWKRKVTTYMLLGTGALLIVFAGGYGLDAVHISLAPRFGASVASLIIALALVIAATALVGISWSLQHRAAAVPPRRSSPFSHAPFPRPYPLKRVIAVGSALAGAASAAIVISRSKFVRAKLSGKPVGMRRR